MTEYSRVRVVQKIGLGIMELLTMDSKAAANFRFGAKQIASSDFCQFASTTVGPEEMMMCLIQFSQVELN